jgi:hypothetical protein
MPRRYGVGADPAYAGLGVRDAVGRLGVLPALDAIVRDDRDHAARSEMAALGFELGGRAARPAATEEEHDRRPGHGLLLRLVEDPDLELGLADLAVSLGLRAFDHGRVAAGFLLGGFVLGARGQRDAKGEEGEGEAHGVISRTRAPEGPRQGGESGIED